MGIADYIKSILGNFYGKNSLMNLKDRLKNEFDIPECNIEIERDANKDSRTGYIEIPKKDNVCPLSIERIITKFYSEFGFNTRETVGKNFIRFWNNNRSEAYFIKILEDGRSYSIDIDTAKFSKSFK